MTTEKISPRQQQPPPITKVSPDDDEAIAKIARTITAAFETAPLMPAFIVEQDNIPPPYPTTLPFARRLDHFENGITSIIKNGQEAVYTGDFSALAIWCPPTYTGPGFGQSRKRTSALTLELAAKLTAVEHHLFAIPNSIDDKGNPRLRPTWHLSFLARNPDPNVHVVKGGISAVIRPFLQRAIHDGVPAWLEATSLRNVNIYQHYGFRVVEEVKIGVGRLAPTGWPEDGGVGTSIWVMIFDDHLKK